MYSGFDDDNGRKAMSPPQQDGTTDVNSVFGGPHVDSWLAVFCDNSVHKMTFTMDGEIHKRLANRADGKNIQADY